MAKPRIIIADTDPDYIISLQLKFVEEFFEEIELDIITSRDYFGHLFATHQHADILIVSEDLYSLSLHRHNIKHIFLMTEGYEEESTAALNVHKIAKYTSIMEVFNEIVGKSADVFQRRKSAVQETQVILVYSASGGVGKTTVAMGICASLTRNYKRVLYINASRLQVFQHMLDNPVPITAQDVYTKLADPEEDIYQDIKYVIRKEMFNYLPPFKAALMSLGLQFSVFEKIVKSSKKSGDFDYIVVDTDPSFDEEKAELINLADKALIITSQGMAAVFATNALVSNVNGMAGEKYIFVCNNFQPENSNALISPNVTRKFEVSDYIEHFQYYEQMNLDDLSKEGSIQRVAFLII